MQQKLILRTERTQTASRLLSFNVPDVDGLFPGFKLGDFAVVFGPHFITSLVSQLCVRAQLPKPLGGLESKVVFIDAANSSSLSDIIEAASIQEVDSKAALGNVINMRAFTAYRLTSLIMEKLEEAVEASGAKLVVISDIACKFLNDNVDDQEVKAVYNQIMNYLSSFAKKQRVIVIATYLPHESTSRNSMLQEIASSKANTLLRFTKTPYTSEVELEKHPSYMLGVVEFNPEIGTSTNVEVSGNPSSALRLSYKIL